METVLQDDLVYYYTLRDIPADLDALGRIVLAAFDVRERFFHFEFFRQEGTGDLAGPGGEPASPGWADHRHVQLRL